MPGELSCFHSRGVEARCPEKFLPVTSTLPGIVLIPQVIGGQREAAEGPEGLREDDHRAATAASMGGLVRVSVGEDTPLSLYYQRSQQRNHQGLGRNLTATSGLHLNPLPCLPGPEAFPK